MTALQSLHTNFNGLMFVGDSHDAPGERFEALSNGTKSKFQSTYLRLAGLCDEAKDRLANTILRVELDAVDVQEAARTATKHLRGLSDIVK